MFLFSTAEHAFYLMTSSAVNQTERVSLSAVWFGFIATQIKHEAWFEVKTLTSLLLYLGSIIQGQHTAIWNTFKS